MAERLDNRALLSLLPLLVHSQPQIHVAASGAAGQGGGATSGLPGITNSTAPPSPRELLREAFSASLSGPYSVAAGRFQDQARQIFIKANGSSNFSAGAELQMGIFTPADPTTGPIVGTATLADRAIGTTGSTLILDLTGDPASLDSLGRPTHFTWTVDSSSGGNFTNAAGQGTLDVRFQLGGAVHHHPLHAGIAYVRISGQVATTGTTDVLRLT
jgi:hypothetical protein